MRNETQKYLIEIIISKNRKTFSKLSSVEQTNLALGLTHLQHTGKEANS